jgi:UDP-N-acetylglucosamine pyrophosphorylase
MSNLYSLKNGSLVMSPQRMFETTPLVKLGDNHFAKVKEFLSRFSDIPDLLELDHLTVSGDVTFGKGVSVKVLLSISFAQFILLIIPFSFRALSSSLPTTETGSTSQQELF